jgi:hypothetical protein
MSNRVIAFGTIVLSVAIVALGWFLGVAPRLADASATEAERQAVQAQNAGLQAQLVQLRDDFTRIDELRAGVSALRASIPDNADYAGFVSELNGLSGATGAQVSRLNVGDASWYANVQAPAGQPVTGPSAPPEGSASADGAATPEPTPAPEVVGAPIPVPIDTTLVNGSNFVAIPVTIELVAGSTYDQAVALMGALQADKRLFLVTGFAYGGAAPTRIDGLLYVLLKG